MTKVTWKNSLLFYFLNSVEMLAVLYHQPCNILFIIHILELVKVQILLQPYIIIYYQMRETLLYIAVNVEIHYILVSYYITRVFPIMRCYMDCSHTKFTS